MLLAPGSPFVKIVDFQRMGAKGQWRLDRTESAIEAKNPSLFLHKFAVLGKEDSGGQDQEPFLRGLADYLNSSRHQLQRGLKAARMRTRGRFDSLRVQGIRHCRRLEATSNWRVVVGLGVPTVYEVGFLFSRFGAYPYAPATALKGLARSWALLQAAEASGVALDADGKERAVFDRLQTFFESTGDEAARAWRELATAAPQVTNRQSELVSRANEFRAVFGTTAGKGSAFFSDGLPVKWPVFQVDVMTVHHRRYYGMSAADETDAPVPIAFLTTGPETRFETFVASRSDTDAERAAVWLREALENLGLGAKTRAGYGWMQVSCEQI